MIDKTEEYYQSPATKEDIEKLDDKLEHIAMDMKVFMVYLDNLKENDKKLIAWTQRAGRMAQSFADNFPNVPFEKD